MRGKGVLSREVVVEVPFFDVDMMQVVWHGHYIKYFEQARCALLDAIGFNYVDMTRAGQAWPVVDIQLRYVKPARFGQKIVVRADLVEWESRLVIHYLVADMQTGTRLTRGRTVQVAVCLRTLEMHMTSPPEFLQAVQKALK